MIVAVWSATPEPDARSASSAARARSGKRWVDRSGPTGVPAIRNDSAVRSPSKKCSPKNANSFITPTTIAKLNVDLQPREQRLDDRTVLVVDEAGMVGTRTLAPLVREAATGRTKVVLVGDPKQLPEIQAGGVLASVAKRWPR